MCEPPIHVMFIACAVKRNLLGLAFLFKGRIGHNLC